MLRDMEAVEGTQWKNEPTTFETPYSEEKIKKIHQGDTFMMSIDSLPFIFIVKFLSNIVRIVCLK